MSRKDKYPHQFNFRWDQETARIFYEAKKESGIGITELLITNGLENIRKLGLNRLSKDAEDLQIIRDRKKNQSLSGKRLGSGQSRRNKLKELEAEYKMGEMSPEQYEQFTKDAIEDYREGTAAQDRIIDRARRRKVDKKKKRKKKRRVEKLPSNNVKKVVKKLKRRRG